MSLFSLLFSLCVMSLFSLCPCFPSVPVFPHQIVEAHRYLESNQQLGKVVVTV
jgi:hypothetical protein